MREKKVLAVVKIDPVLQEYLESKNYTIDFQSAPNISNLLLQIKEYEGVITSTKIKFDRMLLDAATQLKWIARMGSGMEIIDVEYAKNKEIYCCSSPEGNANAVAEQALGMYLGLQHNIWKSFSEVKQGIWEREGNRGEEIEGRTAAIIGLGNNGYRLAEKLAALGMTVLAFDIEKKTIGNPSIRQVEHLKEIYEKATLVSFHVPYNKETHQYFDENFLIKMKNPFTLINLSRGKVVDQNALYQGLINGKIKAAALDVWEEEPLNNMSAEQKVIAEKLLQMPNFIGTPHIGGYTKEATLKMSQSLKAKLSKIL